MYWYAPWVFFWGRQCAFVFPIYVRKYRKFTIDRWIVVYTVCASAVISPLRQWLDSYAKKLVWKCGARSSILFICNTFCCRLILLSPLYIELALVCCTNPDNVHCFRTIFPNLNVAFCLNLCRPPGAYSIWPIQKLLNCQQRDDARWVLQAFIPMGATKNSAVALS